MQALQQHVVDFTLKDFIPMLVKDTKMTLREKLAEKREDEGLKQGEIGERVGIEQATVSLYENNNKRLKKTGFEFVIQFFKAYNFSHEEALELAKQLYSEFAELFKRADTHYAQADMSAQALYVGHINGGLKSMLRPSEESLYVSVPGWIGDRYKLEDIFVATVAGDSMADDEVRESLPENTECYFHKSLQPEVGDIVAVWLERHDVGVLKIYRPELSYTVLQSYNKRHEPIVVDGQNPGILQGVLIGHSKAQPRFRK